MFTSNPLPYIEFIVMVYFICRTYQLKRQLRRRENYLR